MWRALVRVMKANGVQMPQFKGFMGEYVQAIWKVV
jgi:hypothetical protein